MGLSCRLRGTSAAVGRGRRMRRNGREIRKFAREVPATFGDSSFAPAAWSFAVSTDPMEHRGGCRFVKKRRDAPRIELACGDFRLLASGDMLPPVIARVAITPSTKRPRSRASPAPSARSASVLTPLRRYEITPLFSKRPFSKRSFSKGDGEPGSVPQWLLITFSNPKDFLKILLPVRAIVGVQTTQ